MKLRESDFLKLLIMASHNVGYLKPLFKWAGGGGNCAMQRTLNTYFFFPNLSKLKVSIGIRTILRISLSVFENIELP